MSYIRLSYKAETVSTGRLSYSTAPTKIHDIGYDVEFKSPEGNSWVHLSLIHI